MLALEMAARNQHLDIIAMLMDAGVVEMGNALMSAAGCSREMAVKFLLQRKLERSPTSLVQYVNRFDHVGKTPLFRSIDEVLGERDVPFLISPKVVRLLIDAGADTSSVLRVTYTDTAGGEVYFIGTPLAFTVDCLRKKKIRRIQATEEQLHRLEAVRRLLLRVEAVHAVSWLWVWDPFLISDATGDTSRSSWKPSARGTQLVSMLPILRRRRRGVPFGTTVQVSKVKSRFARCGKRFFS